MRNLASSHLSIANGIAQIKRKKMKVSARQLANAVPSSSSSKVRPATRARTTPPPLRKTQLFASHLRLLQSSPVLLFLRPGDFSAAEWAKLRAGIAKLSNAAAAATTPSVAEGQAGAVATATATAAMKLTFLRGGLLPALLAASPSSTIPLSLQGPVALLTAPVLHPPTLAALLALVNSASLVPSPNAPPFDPKSKLPPVINERLALISSSLEGRALTPSGTKDASKLPTIDVLQSQILGLIGGPGRALVGVLGAASGRTLARTLEGYAEGLRLKDVATASVVEGTTTTPTV